jgi:hypothetical protein
MQQTIFFGLVPSSVFFFIGGLNILNPVLHEPGAPSFDMGLGLLEKERIEAFDKDDDQIGYKGSEFLLRWIPRIARHYP